MTSTIHTDTAKPAHVWASAYGGAGSGANPPAIHDLILGLRKAIGGIAATKGAAPYPVKNAKELMNKLAAGLHELGGVATVVSTEVISIDVAGIPATPRETIRSACLVKLTVRFIAADGSYLDSVGIGHGMSTDDKAAGKGSTYAWKDAVLKGLSVGDKDMVDTDDEALSDAASSAPRRPARAPDAPRPTPAGEVARFKAAIAGASNVAELMSVGAALKEALGMDGALALTPEFRTRLAALRAAES